MSELDGRGVDWTEERSDEGRTRSEAGMGRWVGARRRAGDTSERVSATINGAAVSAEVEPEELLLDFLRDRLGLTGAKQSCEVQVCGACTVLVDGDPVSSCCFLAADIAGRQVETIEGLVGSDFHRRAVEAFMRHAAVQCGFCTAGMLLTAKALAARGIGAVPTSGPTSGRAEIAAAMSGNLCRCTGYRSILDSLTEVLGEYR
jgi:aerobic carbon-monoxide dehydrogenase small subunit